MIRFKNSGFVAAICRIIKMLSGHNVSFGNKQSLVKQCVLESKLLKKGMKVNIYLPAGYGSMKKYPVLYMLHGFTGNENSWMGMDIVKKADELIKNKIIEPMIIVMPQIDNSYGINSSEEPKVFDSAENPNIKIHYGMYEDYIYKELIPFIDSKFRTLAKREGRFIGGLSMGGFVSIYMAFKHWDLFSKAGGHSPGLWTDEILNSSRKFWLYPTVAHRKERDPIYIAREKDLSNVNVYLDCGDNDSYRFYKGCEELYKILQSKGVKVQYYLNKGDHSEEYWGANLENYLKFYGCQGDVSGDNKITSYIGTLDY